MLMCEPVSGERRRAIQKSVVVVDHRIQEDQKKVRRAYSKRMVAYHVTRSTAIL